VLSRQAMCCALHSFHLLFPIYLPPFTAIELAAQRATCCLPSQVSRHNAACHATGPNSRSESAHPNPRTNSRSTSRHLPTTSNTANLQTALIHQTSGLTAMEACVARP